MRSDSFSSIVNCGAPTMRCQGGLGRLLAAVAPLWMGVAFAAPMSPHQVLGDWEITGLLVTDGFSNSQRSMKPYDAYVMGRKYSFKADSVTYDNETKRCKLDASMARQTFPIKALFAQERIPRPKLIRDRFYRRAAQYALGPLARESVRIYAYRCEKRDDFELQLNNTGNWFAATQDTIIWPLGSDALVTMKRQPTEPTAEQKAFCNTATLANDKTICADREMWLMKVFTETARDCAIHFELRTPDELRGELDAYVAKRNACGGTRACVYEVLSEHAYRLAQKIPSLEQCRELTHEKK
jgi:hypothetical protein